MTLCLTSTQKESTLMRTTSRLIRTVLVAAGLLAISASAAQAMPTKQSSDVGKYPGFAVTGHPGGPSLNRSGFRYGGNPVVLHSPGLVLGHPLSSAAPPPVAAAAGSPTHQNPPPVIAPPLPLQSAGNGLDRAGAANRPLLRP